MSIFPERICSLVKIIQVIRENGKSRSKEVTKKPTQMQLKSLHRKIFGASHEDAKIGEWALSKFVMKGDATIMSYHTVMLLGHVEFSQIFVALKVDIIT